MNHNLYVNELHLLLKLHSLLFFVFLSFVNLTLSLKYMCALTFLASNSFRESLLSTYIN